MNKSPDRHCLGVTTPDSLLRSLVGELRRGVALIDATDDVTYRRTANGSGSVGAQFRHNLDFLANLIRGIEAGRIDYSNRERDVRVETDPRYAIDRFRKAICQLSDLDPRAMGRNLLIRSELDDRLWLPSSVAREVEFVHSHTVHHHALIAEKLAGFGVAAGDNFGVAPSTVRYWTKTAA